MKRATRAGVWAVWVGVCAMARGAIAGPVVGGEIALPSNAQSVVATAFDGTNYLVVFKGTRGGGSETYPYVVRVDPTGTVLDPTPGLLSHAALPGAQFFAAASNGQGFVVVWHGSSLNSGGSLGVCAIAVGSDGLVRFSSFNNGPDVRMLHSVQSGLTENVNSLAVVPLPTAGRYLVAWSSYGFYVSQVTTLAFDTPGVAVGAPAPRLVTALGDGGGGGPFCDRASGLGLAVGAGETLLSVAAYDPAIFTCPVQPGTTPAYHLFLARNDATGAPIETGLSRSIPSFAGPVSSTFDGTNFLVAGHDLGTRVATDGNAIDTTPIAFPGGVGPIVALGTLVRRAYVPNTYRGELRVADVMPDGTVVGGTYTTVAADASPPVMAAGCGTQSLVGYDTASDGGTVPHVRLVGTTGGACGVVVTDGAMYDAVAPADAREGAPLDASAGSPDVFAVDATAPVPDATIVPPDASAPTMDASIPPDSATDAAVPIDETPASPTGCSIAQPASRPTDRGVAGLTLSLLALAISLQRRRSLHASRRPAHH